jgi:hypothetical protein
MLVEYEIMFVKYDIINKIKWISIFMKYHK